MIQDYTPLCSKHNRSVRFLDIRDNIALTQRALCQECILNNPLSISRAMEFLENISTNPINERTALEKAKQAYSDLKITIIEQLNQIFNLIETLLEDSQQQNSFLLNDNILQYYLGDQENLTLKDYQKLGELLSFNIEKKGEQLYIKDSSNFENKHIKKLDNSINQLKEIGQKLQKIKPCLDYTQLLQPKQTENPITQELSKNNNQYELKTMVADIIGVHCVDIHSKLCTIFTGCYKHSHETEEVIIWSLDKNYNITKQQAISSHQGTVNCIKSSRLSNFFITGSEDNTVKIWKKYNDLWECNQTLIGHQDSVFCISLNSMETIIASGSHDKHIKIWYLNTLSQWQPAQTIVDCSKSILSLCFNPDSSKMISGCQDHSISVWCLTKDKWKGTIINKAHNKSVTAVCFVDSNKFISGSWDSHIKYWDRKNDTSVYTAIYEVNSQIGPIVCFLFIEQSQMFISCNQECSYFWKIQEDREIKKVTKIPGASSACAVSNMHIITVTQANQLRFYSQL